MAGPYATIRLTDQMFLQARAAWGRSSNEVSPFLTYTDSFDSTRWLVSSSLTGRWNFGPWTVKPTASIAYLEDASDSYKDTYGVTIPGVTSKLGQAKIGPEFSYRFEQANGSVIEPHAGVQLIWNFAGGTTAAGVGALNGDQAGPTGTRGRIEFGVTSTTPSGIGLDITGSYDGIGASGYNGELAGWLAQKIKG